MIRCGEAIPTSDPLNTQSVLTFAKSSIDFGRLCCSYKCQEPPRTIPLNQDSNLHVISIRDCENFSSVCNSTFENILTLTSRSWTTATFPDHHPPSRLVLRIATDLSQIRYHQYNGAIPKRAFVCSHQIFGSHRPLCKEYVSISSCCSLPALHDFPLLPVLYHFG